MRRRRDPSAPNARDWRGKRGHRPLLLTAKNRSPRRGYEGEVLTGAHLAGLPDSFVVLHDLRLPGGRENIDHLVIGPTGVFTIETKHYSSDVTIRHGAARCAGRSMDKVVAQANRQANAIRTVVDTPVHAVVCLQGASVVAGFFGKPVVHGVRFSTGARLAKLLTDGARSLGDAEVQDLASTLRAHLHPAVPEPRTQQGPRCQVLFLRSGAGVAPATFGWPAVLGLQPLPGLSEHHRGLDNGACPS